MFFCSKFIYVRKLISCVKKRDQEGYLNLIENFTEDECFFYCFYHRDEKLQVQIINSAEFHSHGV